MCVRLKPGLVLLSAWLFLAFALGACGARDRGAPRAAPPAFDLIDVDNSGVVEIDEWDKRSSALFAALDENGDGFLDADEFRQKFDVLDQNGDGMISALESPSVVEQLDADGSGKVSREEFQALDWNRLRIDMNRNGRVSPDEFLRSRREYFLQFDRDSSSRLERIEIDPSGMFTIFQF